MEELDSGLTAFRGVDKSSSLSTTSLWLSASVEGFDDIESAAGGFTAAGSSTLGGFVLAFFLDGPIKKDGRCRNESVLDKCQGCNSEVLTKGSVGQTKWTVSELAA